MSESIKMDMIEPGWRYHVLQMAVDVEERVAEFEGFLRLFEVLDGDAIPPWVPVVRRYFDRVVEPCSVLQDHLCGKNG